MPDNLFPEEYENEEEYFEDEENEGTEEENTEEEEDAGYKPSIFFEFARHGRALTGASPEHT